jgi:P-type Mg2+ transporter
VGVFRRYMSCFGPLSSLFDFATFAVLLVPLGAGPTEFRTGWFVESLCTQALVIMVIRTRPTPFFHSRPSGSLVVATVLVATTGAVLAFTSLAVPLGFTPPPGAYYAVLGLLLVAYLTLVELGKRRFFRHPTGALLIARRRPHLHRRIHRRAAPFGRRNPVHHEDDEQREAA